MSQKKYRVVFNPNISSNNKAFYRREHGEEPPEDGSMYLACHMGTALLAYEMQLIKHARSIS